MNLDELTQKAQQAWNEAANGERLRAAVLEVLAEVRQCVPSAMFRLPHYSDFHMGVTEGHNKACAEMLRRLDAITGGM